MSYYHVKGGLHSAEIRMIQRALKMYVKAYMQMQGNPEFDKPFEREQMHVATEAANRLSTRLRKELIAVEANITLHDSNAGN